MAGRTDNMLTACCDEPHLYFNAIILLVEVAYNMLYRSCITSSTRYGVDHRQRFCPVGWSDSALNVSGLRATLARSALTCVSLARFSLARFILTRFQFGAFLFGALPLRRVSLWRASTSARFTLARFPILYEPTVIRYLRTPVSRGLFVCMFLFRVSQFLLSKLMHNRLFDHLFPFCACFLRRSVVYASFAAKPLY